MSPRATTVQCPVCKRHFLPLRSRSKIVDGVQFFYHKMCYYKAQPQELRKLRAERAAYQRNYEASRKGRIRKPSYNKSMSQYLCVPLSKETEIPVQGSGRRPDDPTPEEISDRCKEIKKGWHGNEGVRRASRSTKGDHDEDDEAAEIVKRAGEKVEHDLPRS